MSGWHSYVVLCWVFAIYMTVSLARHAMIRWSVDRLQERLLLRYPATTTTTTASAEEEEPDFLGVAHYPPSSSQPPATTTAKQQHEVRNISSLWSSRPGRLCTATAGARFAVVSAIVPSVHALTVDEKRAAKSDDECCGSGLDDHDQARLNKNEDILVLRSGYRDSVCKIARQVRRTTTSTTMAGIDLVLLLADTAARDDEDDSDDPLLFAAACGWRVCHVPPPSSSIGLRMMMPPTREAGRLQWLLALDAYEAVLYTDLDTLPVAGLDRFFQDDVPAMRAADQRLALAWGVFRASFDLSVALVRPQAAFARSAKRAAFFVSLAAGAEDEDHSNNNKQAAAAKAQQLHRHHEGVRILTPACNTPATADALRRADARILRFERGPWDAWACYWHDIEPLCQLWQDA